MRKALLQRVPAGEICGVLTEAGTQCMGTPRKDSGLCWRHDNSSPESIIAGSLSNRSVARIERLQAFGPVEALKGQLVLAQERLAKHFERFERGYVTVATHEERVGRVQDQIRRLAESLQRAKQLQLQIDKQSVEDAFGQDAFDPAL